MSRPIIVSDSEDSQGSDSYVDDDSSMQDEDSVSEDSSSDTGSNSEEEPEFQEEARAQKERKRKNTAADANTRATKKAKLEHEEKEDEADSVKSGAVTVADTQGRPRVIIRNPDTTVKTLIYITVPTYLSFPAAAGTLQPGGRSVSCVLGPAAWRSVNSDAKADASLPCLTQIKLVYPGHGFIAGHLLNAQFGGPNSLENMTALTSSANGQQKSFDNHIVNACDFLQKVYVGLNGVGIDVMVLGYGIQLDIVMNPRRWKGGSPNDCISVGMTCTALVVGEPDIDTLIAAVYPGGQGVPAHWVGTRKTILNLMQLLRDEVATANLASNVTNS